LVNINAYNFFVSGPKFTIFSHNREGFQLIRCFSYLRYVDQWRMYSRSKSKVVRIFDDFCPPKFCWGTPSKIYTHVITTAAWHVAWKKIVNLFPLLPK